MFRGVVVGPVCIVLLCKSFISLHIFRVVKWFARELFSGGVRGTMLNGGMSVAKIAEVVNIFGV